MRRILVVFLMTVLALPTSAVAATATTAEPSPSTTEQPPADPVPSDPTPSEPTPSEPAPSDPTPGDPGPTEPAPAVTLDAATVRAWTGTTATLRGRADGVGSGRLRVARLQRGAWSPLTTASVALAADGTFTARVPAAAGTTTVRVEIVQAEQVVAASGNASVVGSAAPSALSLTMPRAVKDYRTATVGVRWRTVDGRAVTGQVALDFQRSGTRVWKRVGTVKLTNGVGRLTVRPRYDGRWTVRSKGTTAVRPLRSAAVHVDNQPPGAVVRLPRGAARPTLRLPAQGRAGRAQADAVITRIPSATWRSMQGRSWHRGCPVGRDDLRLVKVSYWAFDGYVRRGEVVVHARHATATARVFTDLFRMRAPIRSMYRVDRFGWSSALRGADDYASMRADNTSGFNCRQVVGRPGTRSPHAYGNSLDINPWENPFASGYGWTPNNTWQRRTSPASVTYRGANDPVVGVLRRHGFRWLGFADLHHFER